MAVETKSVLNHINKWVSTSRYIYIRGESGPGPGSWGGSELESARALWMCGTTGTTCLFDANFEGYVLGDR